MSIERSMNLKRLPDIPYGVLMPSAVFVSKTNSVYIFGGYLQGENGKEASKRVYRFDITTQKWTQAASMPLGVVSATAVFDRVGKIYLFGGESDEIDLTCPELVYLTYTIDTDSWEFQVNYSMKSPFKNSRYLKPIILSLTPNTFLWYQKQEKNYSMQIFELRTGGYHLRYQYESVKETEDDLMKEDEEAGIFYKPVEETPKFRQDELSVSFQGGLLYNLDENTKDLLVWNITDSKKSSFKVTPCQIISNDEVNESFEIFERGNLE
jgi:hypothetical protein